MPDQEAKQAKRATKDPPAVVRSGIIMHLSNENHAKFDRKLHDEKPPTWLAGRAEGNANCEQGKIQQRQSERRLNTL